MKETYTFQINEIQKHDYGFFEKIALTREPLTYTFSESRDEQEVQVEIEVKMHEKIEAMLVTIDFTSENRKWIHICDVTKTYLLRKDNSWQESSYDGSEFIK